MSLLLEVEFDFVFALHLAFHEDGLQRPSARQQRPMMQSKQANMQSKQANMQSLKHVGYGQMHTTISKTAQSPSITHTAIKPPLLRLPSLSPPLGTGGTTTARASRLAVDGIAEGPVEMDVSLGMNIVGAITTYSGNGQC
jgi:hypothetical protein